MGAAPAGLAEASMSAFNAMGGDMIFGMAAGEAYGGDGEIAVITFGKMTPDAGISSVALTEVGFNDGEPPAEIGVPAGIPTQANQTHLGRAVPNPFTQGTVVNYEMGAAGRVSLQIYNVNGQLVRTLLQGSTQPGYHTLQWDGRDGTGNAAAAGVYLYRIAAGRDYLTRKMVLLK